MTRLRARALKINARMEFFLGSLLIVTLIACRDVTTPGTGVSAAAAIISEDNQSDSPRSYIVQFDSTVSDVPGRARGLANAHGGKIHFIYERALHGFALELPEKAVEALKRNPNIISVDPVRPTRIHGVQSFPPWGLDRVDQASLPLNQSYQYGGTGWNYTAYIFDSGIRTTHVDFGGRATTGWTIPDGLGATDCMGHGTHVAGTVGGNTYGVAKEVRLVSVRVFGAPGCTGTDAQLIAGIDWVIANKRLPAVANFSLGFDGIVLPVEAAINRLIAAGVTVVVAAGNDNIDACSSTPSRMPGVIAVAASDGSDQRASFSNWGGCVDIFAPGVSVLSAYNTGNTAVSYLSGTSMAAPHVAGAIALTQEPISSNAKTNLLFSATANKIGNAGSGTPNKLLSVNLPISCGRVPCIPSPINDRLQRVSIAPTYSGVEGTSIAFTVGSPDELLGYAWDFGDLTVAAGANANHTYTDNDSYVVKLTATLLSDPTQTIELLGPATITNANPTVQLGSDIVSTSGESVSLLGSFADAGASDAPWSYTIDWGNGSLSAGVMQTHGAISGSKSFFAAGNYTVRLIVTDKDGGTGEAQTRLSILRRSTQIDLIPGDETNTIKLKGKPSDLVPVALLSSSTFDATRLNHGTLTFGNGSGAEAQVARDKKGLPIVQQRDVNNDGIVDSVISFVKSDLVATGDLSTAAPLLTLRGSLSTGVEFQGSATAQLR